MTMQIGMVGTDGILIASDRRWMNTLQGVRQTSDSSKILVSHDRGIAIGCARNMENATAIGKKIIAQLGPEDWKRPILPIEKIAQDTIAAGINQTEKTPSV
ncbi:MAG: hypothetical protein ABSD20_20675 [Terriglobales bacterium]|jgi:hypothetical protein